MMKIFEIFNAEKSKVWRRKKVQEIRHLFRLKKKQNKTPIKDIRNIFRLK